MKKLSYALLAATSLIATAAVAAPPFGSASSDTTTITATIALDCTIDAPAGGTVPVSGSQNIGDVNAQCNDPDGFTATLSSANLGVLKGANANNGTTIPYTFTIGGVQVAPASLSAPKAYPGPAAAGVNGVTFPVEIQTAGPNGAAFADSYSDVITFAIAGN